MKKWLDKYNDDIPQAQNGIEGTMGGLTDKGFNYNGAWGGTMQDGGYIDSVLNANKNLDWVQRLYEKNTPSIKIPGQKGRSTHFMESADGRVYPTVVRMPNGKLKYLADKAYDYADSTKTYIQFPSDEAAKQFGENYKKGTGVLKDFAMGGGLPGAVGFTYARVAGAAPANGPYAKKTKASAQNGMEMKFYQEGLDWKPRNISQDGKTLPLVDLSERGRGDMTSYYPELKQIKTKAATQLTKKEAEKIALQEAARKAIQNQPTVSAARADYRTDREKERDRMQTERQEGQRKSPLAQTMGMFTPSGYNPDAGVVGAETFVNMNPITGPAMSSARLTQHMLDQNPYNFGEGTVQNILGGVSMLGDVAGLGMIKMLPGSNQITNIPRNIITGVDRTFSPVGKSLARIEAQGKAAGLSDWEIASRQMEDVGITSNQRQGYMPGLSELFEKYVTPYGYSGSGDKSKLSQIIGNIKKGGVKYADKDGFDDFSAFVTPARGDAWRLYLGMPQKSKTFRMAETAPINHPSYTAEQLQNLDIYSINSEDALRGVGPDLYSAERGLKPFINPTETRRVMQQLDEPITIEKTNDVMGGYNKRLNQYGLEYNDIWDLDVPVTLKSLLPEVLSSDKMLSKAPLLDKILSTKKMGPYGEIETWRNFNIPVSKMFGKPFMSHEVLPYTSHQQTAHLRQILSNELEHLRKYNDFGKGYSSVLERIADNEKTLKKLENYPIRKNGGAVDKITVDPMGYWNPDNIGEPVIIPSNEITMEGVYQPLIGISDTGDTQMMYPGEDYEFDGEYVTEYPIAKSGVSVNNADAQPVEKLDQLLNFTNYNKPTKGGWLDKYQ